MRRNVRWMGAALVVCGTVASFALVQKLSHAQARPTGPWINLRPPRVTAGILPDAVNRFFNRNRRPLFECYQQQLTANPTARALITARITVLAGGFAAVESLRVAPGNEAIETCARSEFGRWQWPNPRNSPASEIRLQIDLAPTRPANAH